MTSPSSAPATTVVPAFIDEWFARLQPRPLAEVAADPAATAMLSSDMLVGFCSMGNLASPRIAGIADAIADLFQRGHDLGVRDFALIEDTHDPAAAEFAAWPVHCVRGTEEAETIPELAGLPFADRFAVIEKNSLNPGHEPEFDAWLDARPGLRTAIVVGNCTDLCVYQLAMDLRLRHNARNVAGFEVVVPANLVETYDLPPDEASGGVMPHPGDFFHRVFLYHMALNGIQVVRELT